MSSMDYKCPKCNTKNKLILMGNDWGKFEQECKTCNIFLDIEIDSKQKVNITRVETKKDKIIKKNNAVPSDYKKLDNESKLLKTDKKKDKLVTIISLFIISASLMGFITAGALYYSPDEFPNSKEIKIEVVIKNDTANIEDAVIIINNQDSKQTYLGKGSYEIFLKPGKYHIKINAPNHTNANMEVYIPPQDNNLSLVDYNQGLEGVNLFTFNLKEGTGEDTLDSNTYNSMIKWCPGLIFIFSLIGTWGAWTTYTLQSYKNAQIGTFFSILAMGFFIVGPILGIIALFLLPKIKKRFTVPFKN